MIIVSIIVFLIALGIQVYYMRETWTYRNLFETFFKKDSPYSTYQEEGLPQLTKVGSGKSLLNSLTDEINDYVMKTRGTTDFSFIQNKVERKLNMLHNQSLATLAFPTYIGLMGTFLGVFMGIVAFIKGFDNIEGVTDASISNLLYGVCVSMMTSLFGLFMTTINNALDARARKRIEDDKNEFYDFIQTDLMTELGASMVQAITRLHQTVDKFEPAFDRVINNFQGTFDRCTSAFGSTFEKNVTAVASAVHVMGENMDKINENISLQKQLIARIGSDDLRKGMEKDVEAADHFVGITQSLDKFEEARRMMLAAAQEVINLQEQYNNQLLVPREVAVRVNQILERIKTFEENVNKVGASLNHREILGNDVIDLIKNQVNSIRKKQKVLDRYDETANDKMEHFYKEELKSMQTLCNRYNAALDEHFNGFDRMLSEQGEKLAKRYEEYIDTLKANFPVEDLREGFTHLILLDDILKQMRKVNDVIERIERLEKAVSGLDKSQVKEKDLKPQLEELRKAVQNIKVKASFFGG